MKIDLVELADVPSRVKGPWIEIREALKANPGKAVAITGEKSELFKITQTCYSRAAKEKIKIRINSSEGKIFIWMKSNEQ